MKEPDLLANNSSIVKSSDFTLLTAVMILRRVLSSTLNYTLVILTYFLTSNASRIASRQISQPAFKIV